MRKDKDLQEQEAHAVILFVIFACALIFIPFGAGLALFFWP